MNAKQPAVRIFAVALVPFLVAVLAVMHVAASDAPLDLSRALAAQEALLVEQPMAAAAHNDLGNLLLLSGREGEAEHAYRRAIELDAGFTPARFNLALLLHQRADLEEALALYRGILEREPRHAWAHYQLGVAAENAGDRHQAIEHYARAFALDTSLTFAKTNPHIIDNKLVTQSLLRAQNYNAPPGTRVPRQYGDASRILSFMLGDEETEPDPLATSGDGELPEPAGSGSAAPIGRQPGVDSGDEGGQTGSDTRSRALTSQDLEAERSGRAARGQTGDTRRNPSQLIERYRPASRPSTPPSAGGAVRVDPPVIDSQGRGTAPVPGNPPESPDDARRVPRFVPSALSTGSLELELLPERIARVSPAR